MCLRADRQWLGWGHLEGFLTHMPGPGLRKLRLLLLGLEQLGLRGHFPLSMWSLHMGAQGKQTSPGGS